jgi:hypothetical protein
LRESRKPVALFILSGVDVPVCLHGIEAVVSPQQFEAGEIALGRFHDQVKVSRRNPFVGIEHQDPGGFRQLEPDIAGSREIVAPRVMNDFRVEWTNQVEGCVARAGVNNYDVVDYGFDTAEAALNEFPLIFHNHTEADSRRHAGANAVYRPVTCPIRNTRA